jgi:6-phosphogluconolactonase (cycloisomerase 2 family)
MVLNSAETALYVADKGGAEISGFTVAATGALTALSSSPYPAGTDPLYLTLDSTGNFLAVANIGGTPDLGIYKFDATTTGKLDALTSPSYSTTPAGSFLVIRTFPSS